MSLSLAQRTASLYVDISTGTVGVSNLNASNITISGSSVGVGGGGAGILTNVGWTPTTTPPFTVTLPSGGAFTASQSNAQHRWIGNDLGYTFSVTGTVTAAPTNPAADYKISVPYPVAISASYPRDTIVGDLWLSVIYGANSNLFKAYARTLSTDANSLVVRAITGSTDESLGTILAGSLITLQGTATFATTSVNQNTGGALASGLQTVWIPSTAVNWAPAPAPTFGLPAGAALTYARSNARYMYVGTDVTYNIDLGGTLTASPTSAASDYTLSLPYPVAIATYTNNTVIGDLWLSVVNGFNSNTFKAYARTLATNANAVTVRLLTGSADESLGVLVAGSTFTLQGTMNYTTTQANSNIGIPTAYIAAEFKQDVYGNVGLNLAAVGSNAPRARFDIIQNSNIPALIVDQYGSGDAFQVRDGGIVQMVVNTVGNVGIGTANPLQKLHVNGDVTITSTGALTIPRGTTAQRPANPVAGMIRYNNTEGYVETYEANLSQWIPISTFIGVFATGGTVTDIFVSGIQYRVHTFTTVGTSSFQVFRGGDVEYLIVAGGGGGGCLQNFVSAGGGGGGAGGYLTSSIFISTGSFSITIGSGGAGGASHGSQGSDGVASQFASIATAIGGGGGGASTTNGGVGRNGGSGGGGTWDNGIGGSGTLGQGNKGGNGSPLGNPPGGGGGAGSVGVNGVGNDPGVAGNGGYGIYSSIMGTSIGRGGGGGGGGGSPNIVQGTASEGGGNGGLGTTFAQNAQANSGGGGGGGAARSGSSSPGGNGGSGIVIIRYRMG